MGVRPEKLELVVDGAAGTAADEAATNELAGVLVDSSFVGVSTQHTVRLPWEQDVTVFTQNRGRLPEAAPGDAVRVRWEPRHTFAVPVDGTVVTDPLLEDAAAAEAAAEDAR